MFDPIRRKWVLLTPEEWVRRHTVHLLLEEVRVPAGLLAVEREIEWEGTRRRADVVAFDRQGRPWMVVECKAPDVRVGRQSMDQAARYNRSMGARYVVVTNGMDLVGWEVTPDGGILPLQQLPTMSPS